MAGRKKASARVKRPRAKALVRPDPSPLPAEEQADLVPQPSPTPTAAVLGGASNISTLQAQQITPTTAAAAAAASYPAFPTRSAKPQLVRAAVAGAGNLAPASSASASPAQVLAKFNYVDVYATLAGKLYEYFKSNEIYKEQLCMTTCKNKMYETSDPYIIKVTFEQMIQFKAGADLISDTCNSLKDLRLWIIPAAERFLHDNGCVNQETNSGNPCISFSGFPDSMQTFQDFTTNIIVSGVGGVLSVDGRLLIEMPMVTMWENHRNKRSWNGIFCTGDILIIKRSERDRVTYEMKILKKPVELEGNRLHAARCKDLRKVSEIFMPLYKRGIDCPVYILVLEEDLAEAEEFIGSMKYLTHHPAIMPSPGRITFLMKLHGSKIICSFMPMENADWTRIVESEFEAKKLAQKDIIHVLMKVYRYKMDEGNTYQNTWRELLRFIRNVLEHGEHDKCQLELYLAKMCSNFLPRLLRALLSISGIIEGVEALWSEYEVSKLMKIDGTLAHVAVTTDWVWP